MILTDETPKEQGDVGVDYYTGRCEGGHEFDTWGLRSLRKDTAVLVDTANLTETPLNTRRTFKSSELSNYGERTDPA